MARAGRLVLRGTGGLILVFLLEVGAVFVSMQVDRFVDLITRNPPPPPVVADQPPPAPHIPVGLADYSQPAFDRIPSNWSGNHQIEPRRRYSVAGTAQ